MDLHGPGKGQAVADVQGLAFRLVPVGVDENDLGEQSALHQSECRGGTDKSAAYHCHFSAVDFTH